MFPKDAGFYSFFSVLKYSRLSIEYTTIFSFQKMYYFQNY